MKQVEISLGSCGHSIGYSILIGSGLLRRLSQLLPLDDYSKLVICVDKNVAKDWVAPLLEGIGSEVDQIEIIAEESEKSIDQAKIIWERLLNCRADRHTLLLNLGGGLTGDLAGFVASTFMRGIDFIQLPTTLLAQVDASVGGKVAVNFCNLKNIVGCFNQPRAVVIDTETLTTLAPRQISSGFAEIIKHGLIADHDYFNFISMLKLNQIEDQKWQEIIAKSCQIKASIVANDEREGGVRKILNFGHTIGHAVESILINNGSYVLHGEAVAIGIVAESHISMQQGLIGEEDFDLILSVLLAFDLPIKLIERIETTDLLKQMQFDKKNIAGEVKWSLLDGIGRARFNQSVSSQQLKAAISFISS